MAELDKKNEKFIFRKGRKCRQAFTKLLDELVEQGSLNAKTTWPKFLELVADDERYTQLLSIPNSSTPHELFEERLEILEDEYSTQKSILKACVRQSGITISPQMEFSSFYEALRPQEEMNGVSVVNALIWFNATNERTLEKEKEAAIKEKKKKEKLLSLFKKLLSPVKDKGQEMTFSWAVEKLRELDVWDLASSRCPNEETQRAAFDEWLAHTQEMMEGYESPNEDGVCNEEVSNVVNSLDSPRHKNYPYYNDSTHTYTHTSPTHTHTDIINGDDEKYYGDYEMYEKNSNRKSKHKHHHHRSEYIHKHRNESPLSDFDTKHTHKKHKHFSKSSSPVDYEPKRRSKKHKRHS